MAENFVLGMNCKLYYGTALTADPTGSETWNEIENAQNVDLSLDNEETDITTRGNNGWRATAVTLKTGSIDTTILWKPGDAGFEAIQEAWLANTEIAIAAMDGDIAVAGSQGLATNCVVTSFKRAEPLDGAVTAAVTLKPSSFTDWLVIAA